MISVIRTLPYQYGCFFIALLVYAVFGSPTPDHPGWAELIVAGLLLASIPWALPKRETMPAWYGAGLAMGLWFLTVPLGLGLFSDAGEGAILRDVAAAGFLIMPLLYFAALERKEFTQLLTAGIVIIGLAFSLRSFAQAGAIAAPANTDYLANSPEVLFSALFFIHLFFVRLEKNLTLKNALACIGLMLVVVVPFAAMGTMLQRASIGMFAIVSVVWWLELLWRRPQRALIGVAFVLPFVAWKLPYLLHLFDQLMVKTTAVGLNNRKEELAAVLSFMDRSILATIFGQGWGAGFENPAVGGVRVNYTHSLATSLLYKCGLGGVVLFFAYLSLMIRRAGAGGGWRLPSFMVVIPPLLIGLLLYANYKSLGYGLILLALISLAHRPKNIP